ncbi:MAG TPA: type III secretion system cytoplasmic ring protein SctQ [Myxococcaceae bacterium]|nr:type III secretion system cytoplasmic ring protein SctQ [Myxococcaceae bacterium]
MTARQDDVTVVDRNPNAEGRAWRPFVFGGLPKLNRAEARMVDRLESLLPLGGARAIDALRTHLRSTFDIPVELVVEHVHLQRANELHRHGALPSFLVSISSGPGAARAFIDVELPLAHGVVDALLGGIAEPIPFRPLTDIEEGVIAFAVLEALRGLVPTLDPAWERPRLEEIVRTRDQLLPQLEGEARVVVVQVGCALAGHAGRIQIVLPASMVGTESMGRARARLNGRRLPLALIGTSLRAEIGRVELSAADLAGLALGDVVMIGEVSVRCDRREGGRVELRVGKGQAGWMDAEVGLQGAGYTASITSFHFDAPPSFSRGEEMERPDGSVLDEVNMDDTQSDGTELLRDIPLQIAIELARVPITADEVARLRVGQVVDLGRGPGDAVALSVNGKVIAHGQLVELDGQLGVRILSVA